MGFHDELFRRGRGEPCDVGHRDGTGEKSRQGSRILPKLERANQPESRPPLVYFCYFGTAALPVTVKPASDFASVSCGCAPPTLSMYLPARIDRLP